MVNQRNEHIRTAIAATNDLMRLIAQVEMFGANVSAPLLLELEWFLSAEEGNPDDATRAMYAAAVDFVRKLQSISDTSEAPNPG